MNTQTKSDPPSLDFADITGGPILDHCEHRVSPAHHCQQCAAARQAERDERSYPTPEDDEHE